MPLVTVVICTYNRPTLLEKCLLSLRKQTVDPKHFTILIVDNYGDASLENIAGTDYVYEPATGLSNARNRGAATAKTDWIFYLDDDGLAHPDMLEQFFSVQLISDVSVIGGRYEHYFASPPEKWLWSYYQQPVRAAPIKSLTTLEPGHYLSGGILAVKRSLVLAYPFHPTLGMQGLQVGFGEENEWQDRLRQALIPIHYYDKIAMDHLVKEHKQKLSDRIKIAHAHGKYQAQTATPTAKLAMPGYLPEVIKVLLLTVPYDLARVLFKSGFYWQNGVVSTLGKLAFLRGKYSR